MRPESTRPAAVIVGIVVGLVGAGLVVLCVALLVNTFVGGASPFDTVGVARPTPVWLAVIGCLVGIGGGGQLAFENAAYLVRVIRKTPKLVPVPPSVLEAEARQRRERNAGRRARQKREYDARVRG